jgi:hypothetical protein
MHVLFLTLYPETAASPRYRVLQFLPYLRQHGIECTVKSAVTEDQYRRLTGSGRRGRALWYHLAETPRRLAQLAGAKAYDVVFLQKSVMTAHLKGALGLLRRRARRLVFDIDDAVHLAPPHSLRGIWKWTEDREQVRKLFGAADLVLAGNKWLASEAEAQGARAEYFPTVVDTLRFAPTTDGPGRYCVGWMGNPSTAPSLASAAEALNSLQNADIRLVGGGKASPVVSAAARVPWSYSTEVREIRKFSVGIMPLLDSEWTRGKCALKALQYMACGVPCVATPFGAVTDIIDGQTNGLFADTADDWKNALEKLRDSGLRKRLGQAGRLTVENRFSLDKAAPRLAALLESLV